MLIAQTIPHLLNGVSQRPGTARHPTQLTALVNGHGMRTSGLMKRPSLDYLGKLQASITGWGSAFAHAINRDDDDRFLVTIANGTLKVFDMLANGAELTVVDRTGGMTYLNSATAGYRAVTVGDETIIVNRAKTPAAGALKSATQPPFALISVEQGHFSTKYEVVVNGESVSFTTPDMSTAQAAGQVTTDHVATMLYNALSTKYAGGYFSVTRYGSSIYLQQFQNKDFDIKVNDGLGDQGLYLIKGECQSFEDLPARAPDGLKVKVIGDFREDKDDYWVEFDASETGDEIGVWRETVAPGTIYSIASANMPHRLIHEGSYVQGVKTLSALPKEPTVTDTSTSEDLSGFDEDELAGAWDETYDKLIQTDGSGAQRLLSTADSSISVVTAKFDIDTGRVPYGVDTIVQMWKSADYPSGTPQTEKAYRPGETYLDQTIWKKTTWAVTDTVLVTLSYGTGATPSADNRATLTLLGSNTATLTKRSTPLTRESALKRRLTYSGSYPEGCKVVVRLDAAETFTHTVTAGGETAAQVAAAIQVLIDASASYVATTASSYVDCWTNAGDRPEITYTDTYLPDTIGYVSGAGWTTNEFAGLTIRNFSDGSTATVTSNTDDTITATLTGGVDNKLSPGDRVEIKGTSSSFVFEAIPWGEREAGDETSNPSPSFINEKITEVFFYRNRLGFLSGSNVVLSESGEYFNFFRTSVYDLLDGDVIDIESAHAEVAIWHSAVPLDTRLFLWSENGQYELSGEPVLSPKTVRLDLVSRYYNSSAVRPQVIGNRVYFLHQQTANTRAYLWSPPTEDTPQGQAREITNEVPTYIKGAPLDLVGDAGTGFMAVLADTDQTKLYTFSWEPENFGGWGQWSLPSGWQIVQTDLIDNKLLLVVMQTDGIFLYECDLDISNTPASSEQWAYLDGKFSASGGDLALNGSDTDITTPYDIGVGNTLTVVNTADGTSYSAARVNATTAKVTGSDLTLLTLSCGLLYEFRATLSPIYRQDRNGQPDRLGRLQLRYVELHYQDTTEFDVEVTPTGRTAYTYSVTQAAPRDGTLRFPVLTRAEDATIEIVQGTKGGARIVALDWEGFFKKRARG